MESKFNDDDGKEVEEESYEDKNTTKEEEFKLEDVDYSNNNDNNYHHRNNKHARFREQILARRALRQQTPTATTTRLLGNKDTKQSHTHSSIIKDEIISSNINDHPAEEVSKKTKEDLSLQTSRLRFNAECVPEIHFLGEIVGGSSSLCKDSDSISCKFSFEYGKYWSHLQGFISHSEQTQYAYCNADGLAIWNHPLQLHLLATSIQGWPKIVVKLYKADSYGREQCIGYGFGYLPNRPGKQQKQTNYNVEFIFL